MSASEIIHELPKLTEAERRAIRQVLSDLAAENDDVRLCNEAALDGALMLDQLEADHARDQSR